MTNALPTAMELAAAANLHGRLALVTGATSGLGVETARALAAAGADLILGVRSPAAAAPLAERIHAETGRRVEVEALDLCDFHAVAAAADRISARAPALDLLVANAGASKTPRTHQADGVDVRFAGNHLGHMLLACRLRPLLAARGARVVVVSSAAHKRRPVNLADLAWRARPHDMFAAYGESKTANILFAMEATRRWSHEGVFANAVLPGSVMTGLQRHHGEALLRTIGFVDESGRPNPVLRSAAEGAATSVWAAIAPELEGRGGLVLEDCGLAAPEQPGAHPWTGYDPGVLDPAEAVRLWEASVSMLAGCLGTRPDLSRAGSPDLPS